MFKLNKKILPSKNFLIALFLSIILIIISIAIIYDKPSSTKYINPDTVLNASSTLINIDTDKDGLPDWKENLYGTNPTKVDTDGDGTSDFDEINQDRDPLKANTAPSGQEPNDKISAILVEENKKLIADYQKLSDTDKFSRDLLSNIIATQPITGSMSQQSVDSIVEKALADIPEKNYSANLTKIQDLTLLKTSDSEVAKNLSDYSKKFYTETQKIKTVFGSDINLINSYTLKGDVSVKPEMLKVIAKYQSIVDNLIKIPVPIAIGYYDVNYHLTVINDLEKMIAVDKDDINSDKNSIGIFSNLAIYNIAMEDLFSALIQIDAILKIQR